MMMIMNNARKIRAQSEFLQIKSLEEKSWQQQ